jgi:hypothetical protein
MADGEWMRGEIAAPLRAPRRVLAPTTPTRHWRDVADDRRDTGDHPRRRAGQPRAARDRRAGAGPCPRQGHLARPSAGTWDRSGSEVGTMSRLFASQDRVRSWVRVAFRYGNIQRPGVHGVDARPVGHGAVVNQAAPYLVSTSRASSSGVSGTLVRASGSRAPTREPNANPASSWSGTISTLG